MHRAAMTDPETTRAAAPAENPRPWPLNLLADSQDVLELVLREREAGRPAVLAVIVGLAATSVRDVGSLMAVLPDGGYAGSFSGGCIEAAIVAEALDTLRAGAPRETRYGAGSPYIDVRLPCGGGVDILFVPDPDATAIGAAVSALQHRREAVLTFESALLPSTRYQPRLRVAVIGQGAETLAMLRQTRAFHAEVELITSDATLAEQSSALGQKARTLMTPSSIGTIDADPWTAIVLLFHDHDWEIDVLRAALASRAFWIGAMGGKRTREARTRALLAAGCDQAEVARVRSPIGLLPSARDPHTLALSALAEMVQEYRAICAA